MHWGPRIDPKTHGITRACGGVERRGTVDSGKGGEQIAGAVDDGDLDVAVEGADQHTVPVFLNLIDDYVHIPCCVGVTTMLPFAGPPSSPVSS